MRDRRRATRRDISAQTQGPLVRALCFLHVAAAFCHGHGGGTNCIFCHRDHCHVISCSGGHCTNTVTFRRAGRGTFQRPGGVNSSGGNAPPNGHRHPVRVSGFNPPSGIKTTGGNNGAGLIMRHEEHRFGGGHR
jgi:hypothetical protein